MNKIDKNKSMTPFEKNIIASYGERGKTWLENLPKIVEQIATKSTLSNLKPVNNLSYNYVLTGLQDKQAIILKLGLDNDGLQHEANILKAFKGFGAVKVLQEHHGALLLECAVPGNSLKSYFPNKEFEAIQIVCAVMKRLHQASLPSLSSSNIPNISDWLEILDKNWEIPTHYLQKARDLKTKLLETLIEPVLLHGDLHHDNILQNGNNWVVIDPKGVIGEPAFETAAFIRNPIPELLSFQATKDVIINRIDKISSYMSFDPKQITEWCFVQAVLAWIWSIEDGIDTEYFRRLTEIFNRLD